MELISITTVAFENFAEELTQLTNRISRLRTRALALGGLIEILAHQLPENTPAEQEFRINAGQAALELDQIAKSLDGMIDASAAFCTNPWEE
jgi:hypothetical protein